MRKVLLLAAATIATVGVVNAEFKPLDAATEGRIAVVLNENLPANLGIGKVAVDSAMIDVENSKLKLDMNAAYGYVPELAGYNATVKSKVAMMFDKPYSVEVTVGGVPVERLYSDAGYSYVRKSEKAPFVYALDKTRHPKKGLDGKVIAVWQSHGLYFEPKLNRWEWQRARIFQTVEDLYTQSFVMPYLMPMLENAGAYVMSPRERDRRRRRLCIQDKDIQGFRESVPRRHLPQGCVDKGQKRIDRFVVGRHTRGRVVCRLRFLRHSSGEHRESRLHRSHSRWRQAVSGEPANGRRHMDLSRTF